MTLLHDSEGAVAPAPRSSVIACAIPGLRLPIAQRGSLVVVACVFACEQVGVWILLGPHYLGEIRGGAC